MAPVVVASRWDRLGSRMVNMLAAWDFATKIGAPLVINWPPTVGYAAFTKSFDFFELFDRSAFEQRADKISISTDPHPILTQKLADFRINDLKLRRKSRQFFNDLSGQILFDQLHPYTFSKDCQSLNSKFYMKELYDSLVKSRNVQECLDSINSGWPSGEVFSIHIRRGDIVTDLNYCDRNEKSIALVTRAFARRYAPLEAYHAAIQSLVKDTRLCVFSDDHKIRINLEKKYHDNVLIIKDYEENFCLSQDQVDFLDLIILSRSNFVVASDSLYSRCASVMSGVDLISIFPYINSDDLVRDVLEIIDGRPDKILLLHYLISAYEKDMLDLNGFKDRFIAGLYKSCQKHMVDRERDVIRILSSTESRLEREGQRSAVLYKKLERANRKVQALRRRTI